MEIEYSAEEYQSEIPLEKKTKLISKTKLGKTTLLNPNRKYIPPEKEIINENSPIEDNKDTIENDIENEEAIIINNNASNLRNMKENKATFLVKTIIKAYYLSLWKKKIRALKYSTRGYNPQRVNFKKFIKAISSVIKQHKFDYFNEICEYMDSLPMPDHLNHDNNFGTLKIVDKELLQKKYSDKISSWAENNYDKKTNELKNYLLESFKKMKENNELYGQININRSRETDYSNYKVYIPSEESAKKENGKINLQPINDNKEDQDHNIEMDNNKENINHNIYINENLYNDNENYINEKYFNNYNDKKSNNNNLIQQNLNYNNGFNNYYEILDTDEQNQQNSKIYQYEDNNNNIYIEKYNYIENDDGYREKEVGQNNYYIENNNNYIQNKNNYLEENNPYQSLNNYDNEKDNNDIFDENIFYNEEDNEEKENDYNNNDYIDSEYIESDYKRTIDNNNYNYKREDKENDYNNNDYNEFNYNEKDFKRNDYNKINSNNNIYNYEDNYNFVDSNYIDDNYENNDYEGNVYEINKYDIGYENNNYDNEEEDYNNNYEQYKYSQEYNYDYIENDEDNYNNYSNEEYDYDYLNDNSEEDYYFEDPKQHVFENKEIAYYLPDSNQRQNGFRYITNERNNAIFSDVYTKPIVTNNHSQTRIYNFGNSGLNNKFKYFKEEYLVEKYGIDNLNNFKKYSRAFPTRSDNHSFYISK